MATIRIYGKKFATVRLQHALSQREIASILGVSERRVGKIENSEIAKLRPQTFRALAAHLKLSPDQLRALLGVDSVAEVGDWAHIEITPIKPVPVFDAAVAAGNWIEVPEAMTLYDPHAIDDGHFRIRVTGDSMMPDYQSGMIIELVCLRDGMNAQPLRVGGDYYIQRDTMATFKRLSVIEDEQLVFLALNRKKYPQPYIVLRAEIVRMCRCVMKGWAVK